MGRPKLNRICTIANCGKPYLAHGWCTMHFKRWKRHGDPHFARTSTRDRNEKSLRYLSEVNIFSHGEDCIFWPYGKTKAGYGILAIDGNRKYVHREICERAYGAPPTPKHQAAHSCGNGGAGCFNANHLRWATNKENSDDKLIHGSVAKGKMLPQTKLTEDQVRAIRNLAGEKSHVEIAKMFGVSRASIQRIIARKNWRWVE